MREEKFSSGKTIGNVLLKYTFGRDLHRYVI